MWTLHTSRQSLTYVRWPGLDRHVVNNAPFCHIPLGQRATNRPRLASFPQCRVEAQGMTPCRGLCHIQHLVQDESGVVQYSMGFCHKRCWCHLAPLSATFYTSSESSHARPVLHCAFTFSPCLTLHGVGTTGFATSLATVLHVQTPQPGPGDKRRELGLPHLPAVLQLHPATQWNRRQDSPRLPAPHYMVVTSGRR